MTAALPDTANLADIEYDEPCAIVDCDQSAVVFVIMSHTAQGCPNSGRFYCQEHYEYKRDELARFLKRALRCAKCHQMPTGTLEDNMKVIPL